MFKTINVFLSLFLTLFLFSCGGGGGGGTKPTTPANPSAKTLTQISISADPAGSQERAEADPSIPLGITTQYMAIGAYSDGSTADITTQATWSITDTSVATLDEKGVLTPLKSSTTTITASYQGVTSNTSTLTVTDATVSKIAIVPPASNLAKGLSLQLQAIATFSDDSTRDVSTQANWQSSDTAILSVDASGKVTAVAPGSATIRVTLQDASGEASISATNATISAIQLTPATVTLVVGTKTKMTAKATLSDKSVQDVSSQVAWLSSNTAIATVDKSGQITAVAAGSATLSASLLGVTASSVAIQVSNEPVTSLQVLPASGSIALGTQIQLLAIAKLQNGTSQNVSGLVQWGSSNSALATVNSQGLVTGKGVGQVTLSATLGSISQSATLTVTNAVATALQITPTSGTLPKGAHQQFQAVATFSDSTTQDVTPQVTWDSSDNDVVTIDLNGDAIAANEGNATISAQLHGVTSNQAELVVTGAQLNADGLSITLPPLSLPAGLTGQLAASGSYSDGSTVDVTDEVSWSSSDPAVAIVDDSGQVTAVAPGSAVITGSLDGESDTLTVTVTDAVLNAGGLSITTPPLNLAAGLSKQLAATGSYSDGSTVNVTSSVSWTSNNTAVATVDLHSGLVTAIATGSATITATLDGQSATLLITVTSAVLNAGGLSITGPSHDLPAGVKAQLTASGSYNDGSTVDVTNDVSWSSDNTAVATVDLHSGLVTAVAPGIATITGVLGGESDTLSITVVPTVMTGIQITPPFINLVNGLTQPLAATGLFDNGTTADITAQVSWTVTPVGAASVGVDGLLTALLPTAGGTVQASLGGVVSNLAELNVSVATVDHLEILDVPVSLAAGLFTQLKVKAVYDNGLEVDVTHQVNWTSDNPLIATVVNGLVAGLVPGTVTLTAELDGRSKSVTLSIDNPVLTELTVEGDLGALPFGIQRQLKAFAKYSNSNTPVDVTAQALWSSSAPGVIAVDNLTNKGRIEAKATSGTATISASFNGVDSLPTAPIAATTSTVNSVTIQGGSSGTLIRGTSVQLSAQASLSGIASPQDVTNLTTWTSSNSSVLTVTPQGLVTAVGTGSATITGSYSSRSGSQTFTVSDATLTSITAACHKGLVIKALGIPVANLVSLQATGHYNNGTTQDLTYVANWREGGSLITVSLGSTRTVLLSDNIVYTASKDGVSGSVTALSGCD